MAFLPSRASFYITSRKIVVVVKASGLPHVLRLLLGVSKGMLPVVGGMLGHALCEILLLQQSLFCVCQFNGGCMTVATLS